MKSPRTIAAVIIGFAILIILFSFLSSCKPRISKACDYSPPTDEFKIKQNKNGRWAVVRNDGMILGFSTRYRTYGFYDFDDTEAILFDDSCHAKGLLKKYNEYKTNNSFN